MNIKGELFSQQFIPKLLDGTKTRTSRPIKIQLTPGFHFVQRGQENKRYGWAFWEDGDINVEVKPKYKPGDIMYARETWQQVYETEYDDEAPGHCKNIREIISNWDDVQKVEAGVSREWSCAKMAPRMKYYVFKSNNYVFADLDDGLKWRPSIHMPREAARIFLRVTDVKVQRLDDMTEQDAIEDGFPDPGGIGDEFITALEQFKTFWRVQYGPDARWMWVYYLERTGNPLYDEAET